MDDDFDPFSNGSHRVTSPVEVRPPGIIIGSSRPDRREMLADYLEDRGFAVWTAGLGLSALGTYVCHTGEVDLLLMDADLRDLPAPAFFSRLRRHYPGVPCFFIADKPTDRYVAQARSMGATVLNWPMSLIRLCELLWEELQVATPATLSE
jgi:DNA-binding response OmpR family regulator